MPVMLCSTASVVVAAKKAAAAVPTAKVEAAAKEKVDVGDSKGGNGSAAATGGDGTRAKAGKGSTSEARCYRCGKKGLWWADCTEERCSRCHGRR